MNSSNSIKIACFQIRYALGQSSSSVGEGFLDLDNTANPPAAQKWCEYHFLRRASEYFLAQPQATHLGFVSWKFTQKTEVTGKKWLEYIENHPSFNAYFLNPYEGLYSSYQNVWHQGETWHPRLLEFVQGVFKAAGLPVEIATLVNRQDEMAFCNYFIADRVFWTEFLKFTEPVYDYLENRMTDAEKRYVSETAKNRDGISIYPYVMERMFSTFLAYTRSEHYQGPPLKSLRCPNGREQVGAWKDNPFEGLRQSYFSSVSSQQRKALLEIYRDLHTMLSKHFHTQVKLEQLEQAQSGKIFSAAKKIQAYFQKHPKLKSTLLRVTK